MQLQYGWPCISLLLYSSITRNNDVRLNCNKLRSHFCLSVVIVVCRRSSRSCCKKKKEKLKKLDRQSLEMHFLCAYGLGMATFMRENSAKIQRA